MHKTGTTSIQEGLVGYKKDNHKYANLWVSSNHSFSFWTAFQPNEVHPHFQSTISEENTIKKIKLEHLEMIRNNLEDAKKKGMNIIFSGEDISNIAIDGIKEIKNLFNQYTSDIQIIAYIRPSESWMTSALQENIYQGNIQGCFPPEQPLYLIKFKKFIEIFGSDNCTFRLFNKKELYKSDSFSDFCKLIDIRKPFFSGKKNISFSLESIKCIYVLNSIYVPAMGIHFLTHARAQFINFVVNALPGKFFLPDGWSKKYRDLSDTKWMEDITGFELDIKYDEKNNDDISVESYLTNIGKAEVTVLKKFLELNNRNIEIETTKELIFNVFLTFLDPALDIKDFNAERYIKLNPDLKDEDIDPYYHFLIYGIEERREY